MKGQRRNVHTKKATPRAGCTAHAGQLKAKQDEQRTLGEKIMGEQQDMRARAADEARKVYEEQTATVR